MDFFSFSLIESLLFVNFNILLRVEGDKQEERAFLALAFISEALEVIVCDILLV